MIQPLELIQYIAMTLILSLAIGAYIGVAMALSAKTMGAVSKRTGNMSLKPELFGILLFVALLSPLVGTMIYLINLTAAN